MTDPRDKPHVPTTVTPHTVGGAARCTSCEPDYCACDDFFRSWVDHNRREHKERPNGQREGET